MFERREDVRYFLSRVARMVRAGIIEVHAYSLLTTHFHMLVRSPTGELSCAMQWIQCQYSRWFNRKRRRDGPLVRSRYTAKLVETDAYRDNLVRYIDANAMDAGLVALPQWHACGSAFWYGGNRRGPRWLERSWIDARVCERRGVATSSAAEYMKQFPSNPSPEHKAWIERRLAAGEGAPDPLGDLIDAAPARVRAWMQRKAALADGTRVGLPLLPADVLDASIMEFSGDLKAIEQCGRPRRGGAPELLLIARAGLLLDIAGLTIREAASRLGRCEATVYRWRRLHRELVAGNAEFAAVAAASVHSGLQELG